MNAEERTKAHEGYSDRPYQDIVGVWSVGHGINVHSMPIPTSFVTLGELLGWLCNPETHETWFQQRWAQARHDAMVYVGADVWETVSEERQGVLQELAFQMGYPRLSGFKDLRAAIRVGNWRGAHDALLDSKYARQVPERARTLAKLLEGE